MRPNQYNKLKGKKPEPGTLQAIVFAIDETARKAARKRKNKTKGAFGTKKP